MNQFIKATLASFLVVGLVSCLKDKDYDDRTIGHNVDGAPKIIELGFINEPIHSKIIGLDFEDQAVTPTALFVRLAADEVASEDITVTLDTTGAYARIVDSLKYTLLPASFYTYAVPSFKVTIPKGQREAAFVIQTNAIRFDPSTVYGLYFRIGSVDKPGYIISQNYREFVSLFGAKNKYDGAYNLRVRMRGTDRPTVNTTTSWNWGGAVHLETVSGNTNDLFDDWGFGDYIQPMITSTNGTSGFGQAAPRFTFDNATNKLVAVTNRVTNATNGRKFEIDPSQNSYWDPVSKNVYAHFFMTQPGFQPLAIADTFIYIGPR